LAKEYQFTEKESIKMNRFDCRGSAPSKNNHRNKLHLLILFQIVRAKYTGMALKI